jgi:hypothetical protein
MLPQLAEHLMFNDFQNVFCDLVIEIYQDLDQFARQSSPVSTQSAASTQPSDLQSNGASEGQQPEKHQQQQEQQQQQQQQQSAIEKKAVKEPVTTIKTHKLVVSWHSKYLAKMLTSGMREGSENTIRLTTAYPNSLRKLLLSFYDHVAEITSVEELIEMLFLADEYDMKNVREALQRLFPAVFAFKDAKEKSTTQSPSILEFTLENASLFLSCSAKLRLNLEPKIFAGLAKQWWHFGFNKERERKYAEYKRNCSILLESLNFEDED